MAETHAFRQGIFPYGNIVPIITCSSGQNGIFIERFPYVMYISFFSKELNMMLDVYLRDRFAGILESGREGISFTYDGDAEYPLAPLLPIRKEKWKERDILPFFSNLLSDERERELLAAILSIRPRQTLLFLSAAGCDTPGAVSVLPHGVTFERGMREITEEEIEKKKLTFWDVMVQSVATSIDALCIGFVYLSYSIPNAMIVFAIIGVTTFILSFLCVFLAKIIAGPLEKWASLIAGIVFIIVGLKILLEGLGII